MRTRLAALAAVPAPVAVMAVSAASASAAEGTTCSGNSGTVKYSPGLTNTAKVQNTIVKGTLSGCAGGGVTGGRYLAHVKTAKAVKGSSFRGSALTIS